jgi:hypothetical protein
MSVKSALTGIRIRPAVALALRVAFMKLVVVRIGQGNLAEIANEIGSGDGIGKGHCPLGADDFRPGDFVTQIATGRKVWHILKVHDMIDSSLLQIKK